MAKAIFHKSQRVYVKPIGTWAHVEHVVPQWVQGVEEPIKVFYDVGMGRNLTADDLQSEDENGARSVVEEGEWQVIRGKNKWREAEDCAHHPYPGTHPMVITSERDWGGWRVPGAEYDRDPYRAEKQATMIAKTPAFVAMLTELVQCANDLGDELPDSVLNIAGRARKQLLEAGVSAVDAEIIPADETGVAEQPAPQAAAAVEAPISATGTASRLDQKMNEAIAAAAASPTPAPTPAPMPAAKPAPAMMAEKAPAPAPQMPIGQKPEGGDAAPQFGQRVSVGA